MNSAAQNIRIIFFEAGVGGGSVNRLNNLLNRWRHDSIPAALITFFNKKKAATLLQCDVAYKMSFDLPGEKQPEPFRKIFGLLAIPTGFALRYFLAALRIFLTNPDAVGYINNTPYAHLPVIAAGYIARQKLVCHLRSLNTLTRFEKFLAPAVGVFVVLHEDARRHYIDQGIPEHKIQVVYDSIDLSEYNHPEQQATQQKKDCAVAVGSLLHLKGHDICLKALAIVRRKLPAASLTLAGGGEHESELRNLVDEMGVGDGVAFLGYRDDIPEILFRHNIGILASRKEGMPNCVQEYMAAGLPVIVSDLPGIRELVIDGENGFIVPQESPEALAECWIELLKNEALRQRMGASGRRTVQEQRFTPEYELKRLVEIVDMCR